MWLFDHAGQPSAPRIAAGRHHGLWLWGEGAADAAAPSVQGWTAGDDPLFGSFTRAERYPGASTSGVVAVRDWPGTPLWCDAEDALARAGACGSARRTAAEHRDIRRAPLHGPEWARTR